MKSRTGIVLFVLAHGLAGCDSARAPLPGGPSPVPQPAQPALIVFTDLVSGFSTSDLRDADEQIVQLNTANELIWSDGTRLPGYRVQNNVIPAEASCQCWLVVRFGIRNGERRAYLTADYGHYNPGTLVALAIAGGLLVVTPTDLFAPGTHTQSGTVTEITGLGSVPLENASVYRLNDEESGWQLATTDRNGFYEMRGLNDGSRTVSVMKEGYVAETRPLVIRGDTQFDIQLARR